MSRYTFSEFFADFLYVEELRPSWVRDAPLNVLIAEHFVALHGNTDEMEWKYLKFMAVIEYVSRNMEKLNRGDLAVAGSEEALASQKLFMPIFEYAIQNNVTRADDLPPAEFFHP